MFVLETATFQSVSGLLTKGICKLLLNWCLWGEGMSKASPFTIFLMSHTPKATFSEYILVSQYLSYRT